jgi:hypothetical protein
LANEFVLSVVDTGTPMYWSVVKPSAKQVIKQNREREKGE